MITRVLQGTFVLINTVLNNDTVSEENNGNYVYEN